MDNKNPKKIKNTKGTQNKTNGNKGNHTILKTQCEQTHTTPNTHIVFFKKPKPTTIKQKNTTLKHL